MKEFLSPPIRQTSMRQQIKIKGESLALSEDFSQENFFSASESLLLTRRTTEKTFSYMSNSDMKNFRPFKHKNLVISNENRFKKAFDVFMNVLVIYSVISALFYLAFLTETEAESNENLVIWVFFIIDLILNFFTEYIDSKGNNIQNLKMIGKNYLKKWFFIDFLSIIPFSLTGNPNTEYLLRLFRILKMPRLFKMVDIQRFSAWLSNRMSTNHRTKKIYKLLISHF